MLLVADMPPRVVTDGRGSPDSHDRYLQNQLVLLKSRLVLNATIEQAAISQLPAIKKQADPTAWLARNLKITNLENTGVIEVSIDAQSGADVKDQAAIINAIVAAYMQGVVDVHKKRRADRREMLEKLGKKYQDMIHERREWRGSCPSSRRTVRNSRARTNAFVASIRQLDGQAAHTPA